MSTLEAMRLVFTIALLLTLTVVVTSPDSRKSVKVTTTLVLLAMVTLSLYVAR